MSDETMDIAAEAERKRIIERLKTMNLNELVQVSNKITDIKYVSRWMEKNRKGLTQP